MKNSFPYDGLVKEYSGGTYWLFQHWEPTWDWYKGQDIIVIESILIK